MARLTFLGGCGTVTGSKFLVEHGPSRLLVECGLFQGRKRDRLRNWEDSPVDPREIDGIVVSHAHVDHIGHVPRLVAAGFDAPVHATHDTTALARIVLPDSGHLHEEAARHANRRGYSKHRPALPLYTERDARDALRHLRPHDFGAPFEAAPGIRCSFRRAGHILGAASVSLELDDGRRIVVSGDLGTGDHPLLRPPEPLSSADVVLCESTYGDRARPDADPTDALADAVGDSLDQGGVALIPAFAVDRTEIVLHHLATLVAAGRLPSVPVYVDSPMASAALAVYRDAARRQAPDLRDSVPAEDLFAPLTIHESRSVEESKALNTMRGPLVIVSASGMATGGRVLHHLANRLRDPRNCVVLVGFQAPGTRGRALLDGATSIKFFGSYHPVHADVHGVEMSAHADAGELRSWLRSAPEPPGTVFTVHGEPEASDALAATAAADGLHAVVPRSGETVLI